MANQCNEKFHELNSTVFASGESWSLVMQDLNNLFDTYFKRKTESWRGIWTVHVLTSPFRGIFHLFAYSDLVQHEG